MCCGIMVCTFDIGENVDNRHYRIGELAKKAGVTPRTVRYYESLGLLKSQDRAGGGQRHYTDEDLVYLNRIIQLKNYGMSLDEIAQVIKLGNEDSTGEKRRLELLKHPTPQAGPTTHRGFELACEATGVCRYRFQTVSGCSVPPMRVQGPLRILPGRGNLVHRIGYPVTTSTRIDPTAR